MLLIYGVRLHFVCIKLFRRGQAPGGTQHFLAVAPTLQWYAALPPATLQWHAALPPATLQWHASITFTALFSHVFYSPREAAAFSFFPSCWLGESAWEILRIDGEYVFI